MNHLNENAAVKGTLVVLIAMLFVLPCVVFAQERLAVTAGIANLRYGPGTKHEQLWQVEQYHPLLVLEKQGEWYRIKDYEGDQAYIHESLVSKIRSVITVKNQCNIRSKPGKKSQVLFTAEKGVPFKVLERKGNWIKVKHADGDTGWIYKTLVW